MSAVSEVLVIVILLPMIFVIACGFRYINKYHTTVTYCFVCIAFPGGDMSQGLHHLPPPSIGEYRRLVCSAAEL